MSYSTISILLDKDNKPIPQYYDSALDEFVPMCNSVAIDQTTSHANEVVIKSATLPTGAATSAKQDILEAKIDTIDAVLDALNVLVTAIKDTVGIKKITDALPAGNALLGKMGIDQTTPGTTNKVVAELSGRNF